MWGNDLAKKKGKTGSVYTERKNDHHKTGEWLSVTEMGGEQNLLKWYHSKTI